MNLKMQTSILKEMVSRSVKGVGNNKLLPLTSLMCISGKDNTVTLQSFDGTNYLYITQNNVEVEDFYITVQAEQFSKLISKLTCENVELTVTDKSLNIVGGKGNYKIDIPGDENGDIIQFPNPLENIDLSNNPQQVKLSTIKTILHSCKSALATTLEVPCYMGYYCGQRIIATNIDTIASLDINLFKNDVLISPQMLDLLDVMTAEDIDVQIGDNIVFSSPTCVVVGTAMDGIEEFAVEPITELLEKDTESKCTINKNTLLSLLDRISLFVGPYDDKAIRLTFTEEGLTVQSLQTNGVETIPYETSEEFKSFTCLIDIEYLTNETKAVAGDVLEIHYGLDNAIKIVEGNMTIVIALMAENNGQ